MKATDIIGTILFALIASTGCYKSPLPLAITPHPVGDTTREDLYGGFSIWKFNHPRNWQDEDTGCGYVGQDAHDQRAGVWNAVAYPDDLTGIHYYKDRNDAVNYVSQWCKP